LFLRQGTSKAFSGSKSLFTFSSKDEITVEQALFTVSIWKRTHIRSLKAKQTYELSGKEAHPAR